MAWSLSHISYVSIRSALIPKTEGFVHSYQDSRSGGITRSPSMVSVVNGIVWGGLLLLLEFKTGPTSSTGKAISCLCNLDSARPM